MTAACNKGMSCNAKNNNINGNLLIFLDRQRIVRQHEALAE